MNKAGSLTVIVGTMFSGKTRELLRLVERARIAGHPYVIFRPTTDTRSRKGHIETSNGEAERAVEVPAERPEELLNALASAEKKDSPFRMVAIDEGNFFERDSGIQDVVLQLVNGGYRVVVAGLDLDWRGRPFGAMPDLMALADEVVRLYAVCMDCGNDKARFPFRLTDSTEQVVVGGKETYRAVCRDCYLRLIKSRGRQVGL